MSDQNTTVIINNNADALAAQLGSEIGKEAGPQILEMSRANLLLSASRPGNTTSEYKLSLALIAAGIAMVALGVYKAQPDLQKQGVDLISIVGAGYAASRGLAKLGAGLGAKPTAK